MWECKVRGPRLPSSVLAALLLVGCATDPPGQSTPETETTSVGASTTEVRQDETSTSTSTGADDSVWSPERDAFFFATGSHAANAAWLSTGFAVVERAGVKLFDEEGDSVGAFASDRPVYAGTFDADRIVVGDSARFTVLDANLVEVSSGDLLEPCITGVVFGDLYVCGSIRASRHVFTSYDLETGDFVANSEEYSSPSTPMRRVPGRGEFISFRARTTPNKYRLFSRVGDSVVLEGESPHHGDFQQNAHYAFLGDPATRLVAVGGEILRIHADAGGCEPTTSVLPGENCLVREGTLGHLPPGIREYQDIQTGPDGTVFALYSRADPIQSWRPCWGTPCVLQEIDPDTRTLLRERDVTTGETRHHFLVPHPDGRGVAIVVSEEDRWVAYDRQASSGSWEAYYAGL